MANRTELSKSYLHELIRLLSYSFSSLEITISPTTIEAMAVKIHNVMEARWRKYHSIEHVFSVCETQSPHQILSGIFHDVVYLQVDRRIHPQLEPYLAEFQLPEKKAYTLEVKSSVSLKGSFHPIDVVNRIFGFKDGQKLGPSTGVNEYLSAIVAARLLSANLNMSKDDVIHILAGIEATIPFRKPDALFDSDVSEVSQNTWPLKLMNRIKNLNEQFHYGISDRKLELIVKDAVEIGNRDVQSFSLKNFSAFIASTWQLILEGNPVFKNPMFTVVQYRIALTKVEKFYATLDPSAIYGSCDHPDFDRSAVKEMTARAKFNLELGRDYFQVSLITAGFIEAVAHLTGGDAPMVLFMGQMSNKFVTQYSIVEDFLNLKLPELPQAEANPQVVSALNSMVYDALTLGHPKELSLASYLYQRVAKEARRSLYGKATEFFERKMEALDFINAFDRDLKESLLNAISSMATTRSPSTSLFATLESNRYFPGV